MEQHNALLSAVVSLDLAAARAAAAPLMTTVDGRRALLSQLQEGIDHVLHGYEAGQYFLADLMMANFIHQELAQQLLQDAPAAAVSRGTVLLAVVQGDVHDIGKTLLMLTLRFAGFRVIDLGVDVAPARIVHGILTHAPDAVLLSGTLDSSLASMSAAMDAIRSAGLDRIVTVAVGGSCIDQAAADEMEALYCAGTGDALRFCRLSAEGRS